MHPITLNLPLLIILKEMILMSENLLQWKEILLLKKKSESPNLLITGCLKAKLIKCFEKKKFFFL
jgi:hypothetical protein